MSNDLMSFCNSFFNNKNSFIGFNDFFDDLAKFDLKLTEKGIKDSFPPYNIYTYETASSEEESDIHTFIEIACAGFKKDELKITFDNSVLKVEGNVNTDVSEKKKYQYKGIATRMFRREWKLSNKLEFVKASYEDGILTIEFRQKVEEVPETQFLPID